MYPESLLVHLFCSSYRTPSCTPGPAVPCCTQNYYGVQKTLNCTRCQAVQSVLQSLFTKHMLYKINSNIFEVREITIKGSERQSEVVELSMQYCAQIL